jgi:hypothetical protein
MFSSRQLKTVPNLRDPSKAICFRAREMPQKLCNFSDQYPTSPMEPPIAPRSGFFWPATRIRPQHLCDI